MKLLITLAFVISVFSVLKVSVITSKQHWNPIGAVTFTLTHKCFGRKFLPQVYYTFLRGIAHLNGRQNFMWCNACLEPWNIENIFWIIFHTVSTDIKVFVGIQIKIPENAFHFLKCQGIKNYFQTKIIFLIKIRKNDND